MRTHGEDQVAAVDEAARERLGPVTAQIQATLHADEQRAVRRGRAVPRARAGARDIDVAEAALDGHLSRDRLGERAATSITRANEQQPHRSRVPDQLRRASPQHACWNGARTNDTRPASRAVDYCRWR